MSLIRTSRETLEKYGNVPIKRISIRRVPIDSMLDTLISWLSLGKFSKLKKELNIDDFFHLYGILFLTDGTKLMVEKNANIIFKKLTPENLKGGDGVLVNIKGNLTLNDIWAKLQETYPGGKDALFTYKAFSDNCQKFLLNFMKQAGISNTKITSFILQDIENATTKIPDITKLIANSITDLGAEVEGLTNSVGIQPFRKGGVVKKSIISKTRNVKKSKFAF